MIDTRVFKKQFHGESVAVLHGKVDWTALIKLNQHGASNHMQCETMDVLNCGCVTSHCSTSSWRPKSRALLSLHGRISELCRAVIAMCVAVSLSGPRAFTSCSYF